MVVVQMRFNVEKKAASTAKFNVGFRIARGRISTSRRDGHSWNLLFPLSLVPVGGRLSFVDSPAGLDVMSRRAQSSQTFAATTAAERSEGRRDRSARDKQGGRWMGSRRFCRRVLLLCLGRGSHGLSSRLSWSGE